MNCNGCKYDGFIMLGDKKVSYCKYFKETKQNMDRTTHISYYPFQHGYCLHKTEMKYDREALDLAIEALRGDFHCPKCGTIVRDDRQYHDLVHRGKAEPYKGGAESATTTDCISRQQAIEALDRIGSLDTEADREYARGIFGNIPPVTPIERTDERIDNE